MTKSAIVIFCCLSFIIGIGLGLFSEISFFIVYILFLLAIILLVLFWRNINLRILFFGILFLFFGIARSIAGTGQCPIPSYNGAKFSVRGIISSEAERSNDKQKFTVRVETGENTPLTPRQTEWSFWLALIEGNNELTKILVYSKLYPEYKYGDTVSMECKFQAPEAFGNFRYDKYLAIEKIYSICYFPEIKVIGVNGGNKFYEKILLFKKKADGIIRMYVSEPQASILSAILLGNKYSLDESLKDTFSRAGISHIIAISGMHISILEMIFLLFLVFLGISRKKAVWLLLILIFLYLVMIGAPASAVRAAVIAFLAILAYSFGRLSKLLNIIFLAACIMLLAKPGILFYDISFQFSFTALIGIFYLFPVIKSFFQKIESYTPSPLRGGLGRGFIYIANIISISLAAEIALLPLIIYYFGIFSLISPLVNLLVLWLVPIVMVLGLVLILLGFISFFAPLNFILGLIISFFLRYMISISNFLTSFRWASVDIKFFPLWGVILYYAVLVLAVGWGRRKMSGFGDSSRKK